MQNESLERKVLMGIGLVLRCFEQDPLKVEVRTNEIFDTIKLVANSCKINCCLILVPINEEFKDCDCGQTPSLLHYNSFFSNLGLQVTIKVKETPFDIFACAVNSAAFYLSNFGCNEMLIISTSCRSYITEANMNKLLKTPDDGARAAGLVIADSPEIMELQRRGSIMNTFALWQIESFLTVGGMNPAEGNPRIDRSKNRYVQTKDGPVAFAGLETTTLYHLGMTFGQCIAPVIPVDQGVWQAPDRKKDPAGAERERLKRESKLARHEACLAMEGYDWRELEKFILPGYPK